MSLTFGLVEAEPAGEDDVGALKKPLLALMYARRGACECSMLIHAVIDDRLGDKMIGVSPAHGRVIPEQRAVDLMCEAGSVDHLPLRGCPLMLIKTGWHHRRKNGDTFRCLRGPQRQLIPDYWFLEEKHPSISGELAHQVLGTLVNEMPPQLTKAYNIFTNARLRSWYG